MDHKEASGVMAYITHIYPNAYKDYTREQSEVVIQTWQEIFADYSGEIVLKAIKAYIANDLKGFAPMPGAIMQILKAVKSEMTSQEAWDLVRAGIDYYDATANFKKLPEDIRKVLGSPQILRDLCFASVGELGVYASNFMRSYDIYMKRKSFRESIPENLLKQLEKMPLKEIPEECK